MGRLPRQRTALPLLQRLIGWRRGLARVTLLALVLGICALLLTALVNTGASAQAQRAPAVATPSRPPIPTRTPPRPTPPGNGTPSPTPPVTVVPSPTSPATAAPTATSSATRVPPPTGTPSAVTATMAPPTIAPATANSGGTGGASAGPSHDGTSGSDGPPVLLVWGPVALALLAFCVFMLLEARRGTRREQQRARAVSALHPAEHPSPQGQPGQTWASPRPSEGTAERKRAQGQRQKPLRPPQEAPPAPLPPQWLVDAGVLPPDLGEFPPADA